MHPDLVDISRKDSTILLDIRYATSNNIVGRPLYKEPMCYLHCHAARALVRVHQQVTDKKTGQVTIQQRYYVSHIPVCAHRTCRRVGHRQVLHEGLSQQQFLQLVRLHWGVETAHCLWDRLLKEDTHKWVQHPRGMLNVQALHRIASNFLLLYQSGRRSARTGLPSWPQLMEEFVYLAYCLTRPPAGCVWWDTS